MNHRHPLFALLTLVLLLFSANWAAAKDDELYSFDVKEFEKKTWEWKGELSLRGAMKSYRTESVLYDIKFADDMESQSQEGELQLYLESRWDWGWSRLFLSGQASVLRSSLPDSDDESSFLSETYLQVASFDPHTIEAGKRLLRWGKGYAFNPVAFLETPKNPEDPEASREGLWVAQGVLITGGFSLFENSSVTFVYLPLREKINEEFRPDLIEEDFWGIKWYGLIGTTDIDIYLVKRIEAEETDWGVDFASNLTTNFEIHGEFATRDTSQTSEQQSLIGLRYLTENEITWIFELFHDSSGLSYNESQELYKTIGNSSPTKAKRYLPLIQQKRTISRNYQYLKISIKEPFNWLYFTPSLISLVNLDDGSSNSGVQMSYAPGDNWSFQLLVQQLSGGQYTQYGENLAANNLEMNFAYSI